MPNHRLLPSRYTICTSHESHSEFEVWNRRLVRIGLIAAMGLIGLEVLGVLSDVRLLPVIAGGILYVDSPFLWFVMRVAILAEKQRGLRRFRDNFQPRDTGSVKF